MKIKKGDLFRIKFEEEDSKYVYERIITIECINNRGKTKHYFDSENGKDYNFTDDFIKKHLIDKNGNFVFKK